MQIDPKPRCGGSLSITVMLLLIIGADFAVGRPDVRESPFALELQPPLLQPDVTFSAAQGGGAGPKAIDSYGNPIDALRPIDTPDGRKVVSAQGVQFEIPTYASGITEIRRPSDDLLPPHIDTPPEDSSSSGSSSSGSFTTNTTPIPLDAGNPFDSATIPSWLRDFDYPDVGPGVPFDPDNFGPAASSTRSPTTPPRLPTFPTASSAFPSKVTLPLPGSSSSSSIGSSEEPPLVLIPPADRSDSSSVADSNPGPLTHPTTNSITPFAARFEPPASSQNQIQPAGSSAEPFPPSKFEYTKSDEGKVISTPVANNQRKTETAAPAINTGKYTGGFGAPAGLLRPQSTNPSGPNSSGSSNTDIYVAGNKHEFSTIVKENKLRPTVNPGRYNGGFGAPTGVLSPQPQSQSTSQSQSQAEPRPFQPVHQQAEHRDRPSGGNRRTDSRFGGPPGILVPFDNVQRTGGQ
uniref:Leucine-rich repeat extensin-like protein 5 isoform X4 n=1 Tax=Drosophila rhopaloa TaxID=1041015 RepID=A0A6P4EHR4_DRORH